jgi:hypothetical protein
VNPTTAGIVSVLVILISTGGSLLATRLSNRATDRKTQTEGELGSGALALRIANRADRKAGNAERRLDAYDRWRREVVDDWWPEHRQLFDGALVDEVKRLDPGAQIPTPRPMPVYVAPADVQDEPDDA